MDILTWLIVGLIAGVLASLVVGGTGYGIIGDIVVGIVGAFVGGLLFDLLDVSSPFGGLAGTIFVAFIGSIVLLLILRAVRRSTYRAPVYDEPVYQRTVYTDRPRWWHRWSRW